MGYSITNFSATPIGLNAYRMAWKFKHPANKLVEMMLITLDTANQPVVSIIGDKYKRTLPTDDGLYTNYPLPGVHQTKEYVGECSPEGTTWRLDMAGTSIITRVDHWEIFYDVPFDAVDEKGEMKIRHSNLEEIKTSLRLSRKLYKAQAIDARTAAKLGIIGSM